MCRTVFKCRRSNFFFFLRKAGKCRQLTGIWFTPAVPVAAKSLGQFRVLF